VAEYRTPRLGIPAPGQAPVVVKVKRGRVVAVDAKTGKTAAKGAKIKRRKG
jgi:hypothetical protein